MEVGGNLHTPVILFLRKQDIPIAECKAGQNTNLHCLEAMVNEKKTYVLPSQKEPQFFCVQWIHMSI
jgi:hypothetical protein